MNVALPPIHPDELTILDACAGFGMHGEAVLLGLESLGLRGRVVCHIERDAAAAAALVARMAGSPVDLAPVCDTLRSFDTREWRELVDVACAGLPCQPYSPAGKRRGSTDHRSWGKGHKGKSRGPVAQFLRIVRDLRPAVVWLENVPAWVVGGHFRSVGEELCRLGYTIEEPFFVAAADVGAPHERERVFIMAVADAVLRERLQSIAGWRNGARAVAARTGESVAVGQSDIHRRTGAGSLSGWDASTSRPSVELAIAGGARREGAERGEPLHQQRSPARGSTSQRGDDVGDAERDASGRGGHDKAQGASEGTSGRTGSVCRGGSLPLFPPGRGDESNDEHPDWWAWAAVAAMEPALMPRVEPELSMVADGLAFSRSDLLRIGGNGVVTLADAYAFRTVFAGVLERLELMPADSMEAA